MHSAIYELEEKINRLQNQSRLWAERGVKEQIFLEAELEQIDSLRQHSPHQLFAPGAARPLVVAFFGGTGVGKSSLLNRFADQQIARTGIERPTSREVTLYVHTDREVKTLPEGFPLHKVNIRQHNDETNRDILWIDMPDIDSVEVSNRDTVREWIPYIDVLVYVVSPERYRDDRGWRFLLDYGYQHAWLFVINQWDLVGQQKEQVSLDFEGILGEAGFKAPLIYRTDCMNVSEEQPDEFQKLQNALLDISNDHSIAELERRGLGAKRQSLLHLLEQLFVKLGKRETFDQLETFQQENWLKVTGNLRRHLEFPMQHLATRFNRPTAPLFSFLGFLRKKSRDNDEVGHAHEDSWEMQEQLIKSTQLWDDWSQTKLTSTLNKLVLQADSLGLPARTLKKKLERLRSSTNGRVESKMVQGLREGLLKPGNKLERFLYRASGLFCTLLPLVGLGWVAYRVLTVFSDDANHNYLGADFAFHSTMLVLLSWIIPYILHRKLQPSMVQSANQGMKNGLTEALVEIDVEVKEALQQVRELHNELFTRGGELIADCQAKMTVESQVDEDTLSRMLQKELQGGDSLPKIVEV